METVDCLTLLRMIHSAFQESLLVIFEFFTFGEIAINEIEKKKVKSTQANLIFEMNKSLTCLMAGVWGGRWHGTQTVESNNDRWSITISLREII